MRQRNDYIQAVEGVSGGIAAAVTGNQVFDSGVADETSTLAIYVRAAVTGRDQSASATNQNVAVQARLWSGIDGVDPTTVYGLFTAGMVVGRDTTGAVVTRTGELRSDSNYDGTAAKTTNGLHTLSSLYGFDNGSTLMRLIEARGALAAQAYTLNRLFCDSLLRGDDGATYSAIATRSLLSTSFGTALQALITVAKLYSNDTFGNAAQLQVRAASAAGDETLNYLLSKSALTIFDSTQAANSQQVLGVGRGALAAQAYTLERVLADSVIRGDDGATYSAVRTLTASGFPSDINALTSLLTTSQMVARDTGAVTTRELEVRVALAAQAYTLGRLLVDGVIRGDDGATYSAIATRAVASNLSNSLNRLLTDSLMRSVDPINGGSDALLALDELKNSGFAQLNVLEGRARGFASSLRGRRYVCKSPNLTGVASPTTFAATTPTFLIVAGATKSVIIKRVTVTVKVVNAATSLEVLIKTDTANRFSAGGTARAPQTMNQGNTIATGLAQNLELPTATAESVAKDIAGQDGAITLGSKVEIIFEDGLIVPPNGSFLLYTVTAGAAMTLTYEIEFEEAQVQ